MKYLPHPPPEKEMALSVRALKAIGAYKRKGKGSLARDYANPVAVAFQKSIDRLCLLALRLTGWVPR